LKAVVTGAAGFIGSNLTDGLLRAGHAVIGVDNLSTGQLEFLSEARQSCRFQFVKADLFESDALDEVLPGADIVFHLAANADVRFGPQYPDRDLKQNTIVTARVLESMRRQGVSRIAFASTGSVYGQHHVIPTPEEAPFPVQTSLYAASKLAAEGIITAYAEAFGITAFIFRFVSILGERYTHGHVFDFYRQLRQNPETLRVLGDGTQRKSYLLVEDCVSAIQLAIEKSPELVNIYNLGTDEYCQVNDSIDWISERLGVSPRLSYSGGKNGWIGDNPFIFLSCNRIRKLGWTPKYTIREGIGRTLDYLVANPWVLERTQTDG
jgi:UDP-glucose 4-epimerase